MQTHSNLGSWGLLGSGRLVFHLECGLQFATQVGKGQACPRPVAYGAAPCHVGRFGFRVRRWTSLDIRVACSWQQKAYGDILCVTSMQRNFLFSSAWFAR